jgi:hypothetical protein
MAFGSAFNPLFLVYVALFSMSLFAVIIALLSVDVKELPAHFTEKLPRRGIATLMYAAATFLTLAWLGRIMPALLTGAVPVGLETNTTLYIQVLDLGVVVPVLVLAGTTLLRRKPAGYLFASVGLVWFANMGIALVGMTIGQALAGVPMAAGEVAIFPLLALAAMTATFLLMRDVRETPASRPGGTAALAAQ